MTSGQILDSRSNPTSGLVKIREFAQRFPSSHLVLARHAAFPLLLNPDLVYRIWSTFQKDEAGNELRIPWISVADLLLSPLCLELSAAQELYEMDPDVRRILQRDLISDPLYGTKRQHALATFILGSSTNNLASPDPFVRDSALLDRWTALAYTKPSQASRELARHLQEAIRDKDLEKQFRLAWFLETLPEAIDDIGTLLAYARTNRTLAQGIRPLESDLALLLPKVSDITVSGIALPALAYPMSKSTSNADMSESVAERPGADISEASESATSDRSDPAMWFDVYSNLLRATPQGAFAPTLIIGLGGTGSKVVTQIKAEILKGFGNRFPKAVSLLVIDTEDNIKYRVGGWGESSDGIHATGPVTVASVGEYVPITGNVRKLALDLMDEQIRAESNPISRRDQPHDHMTKWFQAKYYLTKYKVDDLVWNLDVGSGRLRQFGRLGLFSRQELVAHRLHASLESIRSSGAGQVLVHVIGSLAGGTGSSLCADVACLVRRIAEGLGFAQPPTIFGHFVLPQAFRGSSEVGLSWSGVKMDFDARAYAALREIIRFQGITPEVPYRMTYDPHGNGELSSKLEKSPYNNVYLYDGQRRANPLDRKLIESGIAPTIADAVLAYIDSASAAALSSHSVNLKSFYSAFSIPPTQVAFSSIGTYTIELPIYHIVEGWSHTLARQALDVLLAPIDRDTSTSVPTALWPNRPGGEARDVNQDLTRWCQTSATRLIAEIVDWGRKAHMGRKILQQTADYVLRLDATRWQELLAPTYPGWQELVTIVQAEFTASLTDKLDRRYYVPPDPIGNTKEQRARDLQERVDQSLETMLGRTQNLWQRDGGEYRTALLRLAGNHYDEYRKSLSGWLNDTLNGSVHEFDSITRKGGKLGYAIAFIELLRGTLNEANAVMDLADTAANTERRTRWKAITMDLSELSYEMSTQGGGLFRARYRDYVNRANELAQFHKADVARMVAFDLLKNMKIVADQVLGDLMVWVRAIAIAPASKGGAYALVARRQDQLNLDRRSAGNAVRWVIADNEPGDTYLAGTLDGLSNGNKALSLVLDSMIWKIGQTDGKDNLAIDFCLRDAPVATGAVAMEHSWNRQAGETNRIKEGEANITSLLSVCRTVYEAAWTQMSIADYLEANYSSGRIGQLADIVYTRLGIPLATTLSHDAPMKTTYMRVKQGRRATNGVFLKRLLDELRVRIGHLDSLQAQNAHEASQAIARELGVNIPYGESGYDSHDPFKISFISFGDLIQPTSVAGYSESQNAYYSISADSERWRTLHVFAAETNALEVELGLSSGDPRHVQRRRELVDIVARTLENKDTFVLAMRCLAYGQADYTWGVDNHRGLLLHIHTPGGPENRMGNGYWRLSTMQSGAMGSDGRARTRNGRLAYPNEYQLTELARMPDLLKAVVQFTVHGEDKQSGTQIDFGQVEETLERSMAEHRNKWVNPASQVWMLRSIAQADALLSAEVLDKGAQIIRLNAFLGRAEDELAMYEWAWRPQGLVPSKMRPPEIEAVQSHVDLWSAFRIVALREMESLMAQFLKLADWTQGIPTDS